MFACALWRMPWPVLAAAMVLVLTSCASGRAGADRWVHPYGATDPEAGLVWNVAEHRAASEEELLADLARADFLLLGETHDNRDHHRLQARILEGLAQKSGRRLVVAFEMIEANWQDAVSAQLARDPGNAAALAEAVRWKDSGWPPFELYEPVFRAALAAGATIVAAGLPSPRAREVSVHGVSVLPASLRERTGLGEPMPEPLLRALEEELYVAHCGRLARDFVPRMVAVQRARDAFMADRLARTTGNGLGVLVTGRGHARLDRGVPLYLRRLAPDRRLRAVGLIEVGSLPPEARAAAPFDWLWFTPRAHPAGHDPCASLAPVERDT